MEEILISRKVLNLVKIQVNVQNVRLPSNFPKLLNHPDSSVWWAKSGYPAFCLTSLL